MSNKNDLVDHLRAQLEAEKAKNAALQEALVAATQRSSADRSMIHSSANALETVMKERNRLEDENKRLQLKSEEIVCEWDRERDRADSLQADYGRLQDKLKAVIAEWEKERDCAAELKAKQEQAWRLLTEASAKAILGNFFLQAVRFACDDLRELRRIAAQDPNQPFNPDAPYGPGGTEPPWPKDPYDPFKPGDAWPTMPSPKPIWVETPAIKPIPGIDGTCGGGYQGPVQVRNTTDCCGRECGQQCTDSPNTMRDREWDG